MRRFVVGLLFSFPCFILAQSPIHNNLADYVGTYTYEPGRTLELIAGDELFAVLDEAKYRLKPAGDDVFTNPGGQKIPFRREANGRVTGLEESGQFRPRVSATVSQESAALARPRPEGQDSPDSY